MRLAAYRRVSTDEQGESGLGLAAQTALVEQVCADREWEIARWFEDIESGTVDERAQYREMVDACIAGEFDGMIASSQDRYTRNVREWSRLKEHASPATERRKRRPLRFRFELVVADIPDLDLRSASGSLMTTIKAAVAENEREMISLRTRAALAALKAKGVRLGRPVVLPDDVTSRIVREREAGSSFHAIAQRLNADLVPTAHGGKCWWPETVRGIYLSRT